MKDFIARLIAYVFVGSFCLAGPLLLAVALGSAVQRTALVYAGLHADGTVIARRSTGSTRVTYAPVFRFTASNGRTYVVGSDLYGPESAFRYGEHVPVIYREDHPESARIDRFAPLWTLPLVAGAVGGAFSVIPALLWVSRRRRLRMGAGARGDSQADPVEPSAASPGFRWAIGILLTGSGLVLLALGLGIVSSDSSSLNQSRALVTGTGVLLTTCGVLIAQWVPMGSRLSYALGGMAITSMAFLFGCVAIYGQAADFSGGVAVGGVAVGSGGSAALARVVFGAGAVIFAVGSLLYWVRVVRRSG